MLLGQILITFCMIFAAGHFVGVHPWGDKTNNFGHPNWYKFLLGFYFGLISVGYLAIAYTILRSLISMICGV
jgi:hypothetical protein